MKHTRQFFALLLALVLTLGLCATAFADEAKPGSITIDNAVDGKEYSIYRIFDMDSHNGDYSALNYKVNANWSGFFAAPQKGLNYVNIDDQGYVTWKENARAADFAKDAIEYAANGIAVVDTKTANDSKVTFSGLDLGYYLVKSGLGATCSLDTTMPDVLIKEKNSDSILIKEITEDGNGKEVNDAAVGDTVNFKIQVTVNDGNPVKYVIHDAMSEGLTFDSTSVVVTLNGVTLTGTENYTLVTTGLDDGCTFHIVFTDDTDTDGKIIKSHALKANDEILVTYSATLNEKAVVKTEANTNKAKLVYSDKTGTEWDTTKTYSLQLDAFKHDADNNPLKDAKFVLYRKNAQGNNEYAILNSELMVKGWTADDKDATVITTPEAGKFSVKGLDAATYYLRETEAPAGYNKLANDVKVAITGTYGDTGTTIAYNISEVVDGASVTEGATEVGILNQTGAELPSTGGIGTTVFYVLGSAMALGAVILLVTKKRMAA